MIYDLPYQLIHRVASACKIDKKQTHVVYLGFDLNKTKIDYYQENIISFSKLLGDEIKIHLICFEIDKLDEQKRLELKWDNKERYLSNEVINGITNNTLMKFNKS
jgi:hypothetical protein